MVSNLDVLAKHFGDPGLAAMMSVIEDRAFMVPLIERALEASDKETPDSDRESQVFRCGVIPHVLDEVGRRLSGNPDFVYPRDKIDGYVALG